MPQYESVATSEGKKLKLERPITPTRTVTAQAGPAVPMDTDDSIRSTHKKITITKLTYKTASGEPIETKTTVSRLTSDDTVPQGEYMTVCACVRWNYAVNNLHAKSMHAQV